MSLFVEQGRSPFPIFFGTKQRKISPSVGKFSDDGDFFLEMSLRSSGIAISELVEDAVFYSVRGNERIFSLTGSSDFHGEKTLDQHFSVFPNFVKRLSRNIFIFGLRLRLCLRQFSPRRTRERIFSS